MKVTAEIVNGKCPTCDEYTMLVGLTPELYRCMNCGSDLQQHVNGKISYLPHIAKPKDTEHSHTATLINKKEIELLKVQIEEIKVSTKNPLSN